MHFVVGPADVDPRFQDVILPLEIAETYWGIPAHARILDALAEEPWQQDLEIEAVRRAGKLGALYIDAEGDLRIRQPEPPSATECCLYEYGPVGFCRTAIATGTPEHLTALLGDRLPDLPARRWAGHPYDLFAFARNVQSPARSGFAITSLAAKVITFPGSHRRPSNEAGPPFSHDAANPG
ncbi:hypothetical protein ACFOGJ_24305 [Marinibaculum pumilum]|uniref:Uncharacterized protein n=1 Tax=Marinibaculum pumilum TaxID=1766165 RepID=A0ABV7L7J2_9PROT